jgi:hypothetical protein
MGSDALQIASLRRKRFANASVVESGNAYRGDTEK